MHGAQWVQRVPPPLLFKGAGFDFGLARAVPGKNLSVNWGSGLGVCVRARRTTKAGIPTEVAESLFVLDVAASRRTGCEARHPGPSADTQWLKFHRTSQLWLPVRVSR